MRKLVLIDSNALVHRAFHALPPLTAPDGRMTNAVYGFTSVLLKMIADLKPDYIAATFDLPGPTFRHEEYESYKATRIKAPDELYEQIPVVKEILGRQRSFIHLPDGSTRLARLTGEYWRDIAPVGEYRVVQYADNLVEAFVTSPRPLLPAELEAMKQMLRRVLHADLTILVTGGENHLGNPLETAGCDSSGSVEAVGCRIEYT